jgi:hypothetical protein
MRPRTLLVLLVVVLGLGAFIWFYERELPSSEERTEQEKKALVLKKDEVDAVTLQSDAGTVRLEKVAKKEVAKKEGDEEETAPAAEWRITQPMKARADAMAVEGLLDAISALDKVRTLEDVKPGEVGLDRPRATVRVKTADGEKVLQIGAEIPTSATTIAALEGGKGAWVVSDSILTEIRRKPGDWRDRQIYRGDRDHVRRITMATGGQRVVLASDKGGPFRLESPFKDRADRDKVDDLFAELSGLTAERFVDEPRPAAELGLQPPRAVVEVTSDESPPFRIELGGEAAAPAEPGEPPAAKTWYARSNGQVLELRTRLEEAAARPAADWRAQSLSALQVFEVESATVQDARGTLGLQRAETDWKRGSETISYLPVSDFLFALLGARADRLVTPDEAVSVGILPEKPALTVSLKTKDHGQETLKLYPAVAAGVPATASDRDPILLLPSATLGEIQARLAEVRKAKPVGGEAGKK